MSTASETSDQIYRRLIRQGCTVTQGHCPHSEALRIRVSNPAHGAVTKFVPWTQLDQAIDGGEQIMRATFEDIERNLYRHVETT